MSVMGRNERLGKKITKLLRSSGSDQTCHEVQDRHKCGSEI